MFTIYWIPTRSNNNINISKTSASLNKISKHEQVKARGRRPSAFIFFAQGSANLHSGQTFDSCGSNLARSGVQRPNLDYLATARVSHINQPQNILEHIITATHAFSPLNRLFYCQKKFTKLPCYRGPASCIVGILSTRTNSIII